MTKSSNATKRALLVSALSIVMCLAMLIGTTFAWFTDTASTGLNKIQAGNLDVKLSYKDGETFKEVDTETKLFGNDGLWEPGHVEYAVLKVENAGTLALKYKLGINIVSEKGSVNVNGDSFNLSDYIRFAVIEDDLTKTDSFDRANLVEEAEGAEIDLKDYSKEGTLLAKSEGNVVTLVVWMPTNVGNDANYKTGEEAPEINFGINVVATQFEHEEDSFGNDYDKDAQFPVIVTASNNTDYNTAIANAGTGKKNQVVTVKLAGDQAVLTGTDGLQTADTNKISIDFAEKTVEIGGSVGSKNTRTNGAQLLKGSTVLLENGTYKFAENNAEKRILIQNYSNLTLNNFTLDASDVGYALSSNCGNVVIKGNSNIKVKDGGTALDIMHWECTSYIKEGSHVVFDETMTGTVDGKIEVYCYEDATKQTRTVDDGGATLVIKGGTFLNSGLELDQFKAFVPDGYTVTQVTNGYKVTKG